MSTVDDRSPLPERSPSTEFDVIFGFSAEAPISRTRSYGFGLEIILLFVFKHEKYYTVPLYVTIV
jgi:hypothetical protein